MGPQQWKLRKRPSKGGGWPACPSFNGAAAGGAAEKSKKALDPAKVKHASMGPERAKLRKRPWCRSRRQPQRGFNGAAAEAAAETLLDPVRWAEVWKLQWGRSRGSCGNARRQGGRH